MFYPRLPSPLTVKKSLISPNQFLERITFYQSLTMINQLDALMSHGRQLFLSLSLLGETGIDASPGVKEQMDKKSVAIIKAILHRS